MHAVTTCPQMRVTPDGAKIVPLSRRFRVWLAAAATLLLLINAPAVWAKGEPEKVEPPKPVDEFALKDHRDLNFGKDELTGKWSLVLLGFTHCPDICPFTLQNLTQVVQAMSMRVTPDRIPQVVFVGVDPARDKAVIADYVKSFSPDFVGVTGEWDEIKKVVVSLDGFVRIEKEKADTDDYQVFHSAYVSVIDPKGRLAAQLSPPMDPNQSAQFLAGLMRDYVKEMN